MIDSGTLVIVLTSLMAGGAAFYLYQHLGSAWDYVAGGYTRTLVEQMEALRVPADKVYFYMRLWGATLLAVVVVFGVLFHSLLVIPLFILVYRLPAWVMKNQIEQRKVLLRDQMVAAAGALANTSRAGLTLAQGLELVAKESKPPLAEELGRVVTGYQYGRPLSEVLDDTRVRLNIDSFTMFSSAINVALERGGKVTEALDKISAALLEVQRLDRQLDAHTAAGRTVTWVLAIFPAGFLGILYLLDPPSVSLMFTTILGQILLLLIVGLIYLSVWLSGRILGAVQ